MSSEEEKRNQRKSLYISVGVHSALLILFFFLLAWKEPFPPIPEYGIELNFGLDDRGSGSVQREAPVTPEPVEELTESQDNTVEEESTEAVEEAVEEPVEEIVEETEPAEETVEEIESPDVVESTPVEESEPANEPAVVPVEETATEAETTTEQTDPSGGVNQGDDTEEVGDKGKPEGVIDERALLGTPGAGGGASLNMAGWTWDFRPNPKDNSQENGRIVFSITIDEEGEIISIRTVEKTVTPAVERIYRAEVEKLTFSTTSDNTQPAPTSSGTITFIITSK